MGKQKQQVLSRFFSPKPKSTTDQPPPQPQPPPPKQQPTTTTTPPPPTPPPKVTAMVSFSPSKRKLLSAHLTPPKRPKPSDSLHQRFVEKLLEPSSSSITPTTTSTISSSKPKKYTPLEQQVVELKKKYPDVLLMVEVGYRFRFFGEDAEVAARVLGIYSHVDHNFLTASVPTFRLNFHVRRLVNGGYKVGVVKQTETAAIKAHGENRGGPFERGLSALYTKSTLEAAREMGGSEESCGGESSYLCCVVERSEDGDNNGGDVRVGVVGVEVSTGDVVFGEFSDGVMRFGVEALLSSLSPVELIIGEPISKLTEKLLLGYAGPASNVRVERFSRDCFSDGGALAEVMSSYEKFGENEFSDGEEEEAGTHEPNNYHSSIEGIMNMPDLAVQALALTIRHLKQFGLQRILCLGASFRPLSTNLEMNLSANTLQQLEVLRNSSDGSESGSLLQVMNRTLTVYGSRLLKHWVTHPLCDRNMISDRLDAVSEIAESMWSYKGSKVVGDLDDSDFNSIIVQPDIYSTLSAVLTSLGRSPDIQRGITRIFHRTISSTEFIAVIEAVLHSGKQLQRLHVEDGHNKREKVTSVRSTLLKKLILAASSPSVVGTAAKLLSTISKEASEKGDLTNLIIISGGQFEEVSRARQAVQSARENLDSLISLFRKQVGIHNLEFMSVSGITHLIELPSEVKVPLNWVKVNSTKKTIRYHPSEVLTALDQLSLANEELLIVCRAAWDSFLKGFNPYFSGFQAAVQALATLDCLHSLATLSKNKDYVRPVFVENAPVQIHISSGRHPVLETVLNENFVPNDTDLHADREYCQIITGPNMGGKSCYIRQVALIALMAQVGSFVPARSAKLHVLDGIYTRMGASDSIQQGRSTFLDELSEASYILGRCTNCSLVIIDELGRGTSTHDGEAIAYATLHYLLAQKRCMVLFVTHYPKIADIKTGFPASVGTYHVSYLTSERNGHSELDDDNVTYLYKLVPGVAEKSFGFKVAQLAQLPSACITKATKMAARLEAAVHGRLSDKSTERQFREKTSCSDQQRDLSFIRFHSRQDENHEKCSAAYGEFFVNLKLATANDTWANSLQFLKNARNLARELTQR